MASSARFLGAAVLIGGLAMAPAAHADSWQNGWSYRGGHHHHRNNNNAAGAAIIGGLMGLGLGAAIASSNGYYAPPPSYYAPPSAYYAPPYASYYAAPPPAGYYGSGYYGY
jgi:hypothetical protein